MFWRKKKAPDTQENAVTESSSLQPSSNPISDARHSYQQSGVTVSKESISYSVSSVAEAKFAIKELRLRKKQVGLEKREVTQAISAINAERRMQTASQGSMTRGRGQFARTIRTFESLGRDAAKQQHAARLQPYQQEKARLDQYTLAIDRAIAELESYIHRQGN